MINFKFNKNCQEKGLNVLEKLRTYGEIWEALDSPCWRVRTGSQNRRIEWNKELKIHIQKTCNKDWKRYYQLSPCTFISNVSTYKHYSGHTKSTLLLHVFISGVLWNPAFLIINFALILCLFKYITLP